MALLLAFLPFIAFAILARARAGGDAHRAVRKLNQGSFA